MDFPQYRTLLRRIPLAMLGLLLLAAGAAQAAANAYPYLTAESDVLFKVMGELPRAHKDRPRHAVRVSRVAVDRALISRRLPVQLPDGQRFELKIEREERSLNGDLTVIGKLDTGLGRQSAVVTLGSHGVFGVLPTPEGRVLQLSTSRGASLLEPMGGMKPLLADGKRDGDDVLAPPSRGASGQPGAKAKQFRTSTIQTAAASGSEVQIDLLGVYASNLVALRGSKQAAETEFVNQVAVANQAYLDSGTVVRLRLVGLRESDIPAGQINQDVLYAIQADGLADSAAIHALRDSLAADLVAVLRPYASGDPSCGIAWLSGWDLSPTQADPEYGYSVNNVGDNCGTYVLAHEIGHNLGSHHDIETASRAGIADRGAYPYSYGYRQNGPPAFASVMAYQANWQQTWLGQFSRPGTTACLGVACGLAEQADNVRSINQMAGRIARFRDPAGTLSVLDAIALEGNDGSQTLNFLVRLAAPAPAGGVSFDIATADGTAVAGSDYQAKSLTSVHIAAGEREYVFSVSLLGDQQVEAEESLGVRLSNVTGASVFDGEAVGILRDDDDKVSLSGRVTFMANTAAPAGSFTLRILSSDGEISESADITVSPPEFRFERAVRKSTRVWLEILTPPAPYLAQSNDLGLIGENRTHEVTLKRRPRVSGRLRFPEGVPAPTAAVGLVAMGMEGVSNWGRTIHVFPPEFEYEFDSLPDVDVWVGIETPPAPFQPLDKISLGRLQVDRQQDLLLYTGAVVSGRLRFPAEQGEPKGPVVVSLSWPSGFWMHNSVNVYPPDYRFSIAVPPGQPVHLTAYNALPYAQAEVDLGVVSAAVDVEVPMALAPTVTLVGVRLDEGNSGQTLAQFWLERSSADGSGWASLRTEDGTALANQDYVPTSMLLMFAPGETRKVFEVPVLGDTEPEADEFFSVRMDSSYELQPRQRVLPGTIRDDDGGTSIPQLWLGDAEVEEGAAGSTDLRLLAQLSRPAPAGGVGFTVSTRGGTATAGSDFMAVSGRSVRIGEGAIAADVAVQIIGDAQIEADETFSVEVSAVSGATLTTPAASVRVLNDDLGAPPVPGYDHYAVEKGKSLQVSADIGVLANDHHADRAGLVAYYAMGTPSHGQISWNTDGSFQYTPDPGFSGQDRLLYTVMSGASPAAPSAVGKVDFSVVDPLSADDQYLWLVPPAANNQQEGFIRLLNREDKAGTATVWGIDASGRRSTGMLTLNLAARQAVQFNSKDLERGNLDKGLTGGLGAGEGNWTLVVRSTLDIDALAYIRTPDGFVTSMHDRVEGDGVDWVVPMFNPASNGEQVSRLRLVNSTLAPVGVQILGYDDSGAAGQGVISLTLPPLASREYSSIDLEQGNADKGLIGSLGDGQGKWRLTVSATDRITVQSLLADPKGYLTNLSTFANDASGSPYVLWMVTPGDETQQQGFLRLTNLDSRAGTVSLWGVDDRGVRSPGTATLRLAAGETKHLNSQDLEQGNASKGLSGGLGDGQGDWRVVLSTEIDLLPMGLIRTPSGFVTTMHDVVLENARQWRVPMFNPGANLNQVSVLRLVNPGATAVNLTIAGIDDAGRPGPGGTASYTLAANAAVEFTAQELEAGSVARGLVGRIGDGNGKWMLQVNADAAIKVISMLRDPNGYLTNLSNETRGAAASLEP